MDEKNPHILNNSTQHGETSTKICGTDKKALEESNLRDMDSEKLHRSLLMDRILPDAQDDENIDKDQKEMNSTENDAETSEEVYRLTHLEITRNLAKSKNFVPLMQNVLILQSAAIAKLATSLGKEFNDAVIKILNLNGKLAVTGMGKSGHIARKIAATMASTGTPAYFIHPSEASHGDLGMMSTNDGIMALSNSGETAELSDILLYASRHHMPIIGMTKNPDSFLAKHSDILLLMPDEPEAKPLDCAPTTSTTLMLATGDALAMALLDARGFTERDFHAFHPGGKLGARLMTVKEIMHKNDEIPLVEYTSSMIDVICEMTDKGFGCTGITRDGKLVGIITDGDLRRNMSANLPTKNAVEIMTPNPHTISDSELASVALKKMQQHSITTLFIVGKNGVPEGLLHIHDCLKLGLA